MPLTQIAKHFSMKEALEMVFRDIRHHNPRVLGGALISTCYYSDQVKDASNGYVVNRSNVRVLVEWLQSSVLFQSTYHNYDDVAREEEERPLGNQMAVKFDFLELPCAEFQFVFDFSPSVTS